MTSADVEDPALRAMLEDFDAMPVFADPAGAPCPVATREGRAAIRNGWMKGAWKDAGLWPEGANPTDELRRRMGAFFSDRYASIAARGSDA